MARSKSVIEEKIGKLEASLQEARRKEEQARRLLNDHLEDESASAYSSDLVAVQANIRALDDAIVSERSELKKVNEHLNSKEGKEELKKLDDLLKVHESIFKDVKEKARDLLSTCEKLDASLREYDQLASRNSALAGGQAYMSIRLKKRYSWVKRFEGILSKWLEDEHWLNFKL